MNTNCEAFVDYAHEGFFDKFRKKKDGNLATDDKNIRDYPHLENVMETISHFIHMSEISEMQRLNETDFAIETSVIWYANGHFCQCAYVQGDASKVNFNKIISNAKKKYANLIKKNKIEIEKDEYKYCDGIYVNAYV